MNLIRDDELEDVRRNLDYLKDEVHYEAWCVACERFKEHRTNRDQFNKFRDYVSIRTQFRRPTK